MKFAAVLAVLAASASANAFTIAAWSNPNYSGTQFQTSGHGTFYLSFTAKSYKWISPGNDGCCIKFCNGSRETGYRCPAYSNTNVLAINQFNKVVTGCGSTVLNC
ncbi:hypothetical protein CVT24_009519 [Panaeolus cyanescens]|uniref:Uncharacterized protein n=1 Tax=Panaeolus cyanescens TaxID=181874 RepID=A0A409X462_9AGAR|nr:hypothetical protein CVT24_009519 [Panaeolus cyanescens]